MKKKRKHKNKIKHERYSEISIRYCDNNCPKSGSPLKVVLFYKEEKLRGHAVRHYIYDEVAIKTWKDSFDFINIEEIAKCRNALKDIGCPGPLCLKRITVGSKHTEERCNLYDECGEIVKKPVTDYLKMTYEIIKEGCEIPRYACNLEAKGESIWIMPDKKMIVIAYFDNKGFYNTATCYPAKMEKSWQEARDYAKRRIYENSLNNKPTFCTESTWRSGFSLLKEAFQKAITEQKEKEI